MADFVEILSPKALRDLLKANAELVKMIANINTIGANIGNITLPSQTDAEVRRLNRELQRQQRLISQLQSSLQNLNTTRQAGNQRTAEEIANQRALTQNADREARANSRLVGAYANLNAQHQIASRRLQDLIVRGRQAGQTQRQYNRELRQAQTEFNTLNQRIISADRAVGRFNRNVGNYPMNAVRGIRDLVGAFGIVGGVSLFAMVTKDIISTGKELQGLNNALMLVTETQSNFAEQQQFLQRISEAYGLELMGLTQQFTQFYVSAKDKISGQEIQQIFESVSKAGASMGLSVQQQERAFLALNQMMSKGSIQAEELRGQLGEALPGAFGIMAKAAGVTEQELGKMMKAGELLASDVLPKFAKQLEITYGIENIDRIETMTTATNRLSNAWTKFVESITSNDGVLSKSLTATLNVLSKIVDGVRLLTMTEAERNAELKSNVVGKHVEEFKQYLSTLDLTNKAILQQTKNLVLFDLQRNASMRKEIEALKLRRMEIIANQRTGGVGSGDKAELDAIDKKLKVYPILIEKYIQQAEALNEAVVAQNKSTKASKEETESKVEAVKVKQKERDLIVGSVEWLEKEISLLKEKQSQLSTTTEQYDEHEKEIKTLIGSLEILTGQYKKLDEVVKDTGVSISEFDLSDEGVDAWYDKMAKSFEKAETDWKGIFDDWSGVAMQSLDLVSQAQDNEFVKRMNQLEKERDLAIQFAGDSAEAKEEIDRQYEQKRLALEKKRFEQEKRLNIIRAVIDTAGAVIGALPDIPLAIAVGALGAIQLGIIASQQYPEFYKGTDDAPEGWAWTQERGREIITDRNGKIKSTGVDGGAKMTYLKKGDKVIPNEQTEAILFNNELNSMLVGSGISPSITVNNNNEKLEQGIKDLTQIIKNKSSITVIEDKRGKRIFEKSQSSRKELVNNRIKIKGSDV